MLCLLKLYVYSFSKCIWNTSFAEHLQKWLPNTIEALSFVLHLFSEPLINASDHLTLLTDYHGPPVTLQCNLTSTYNQQESFWMKNGEEIQGTRTELKAIEYT